MLVLYAARQNIKLLLVKVISREIVLIIFSTDDIRYHPAPFSALLAIQLPSTGSDLQQLICALQWMKQRISNFLALVAAPHFFMKKFHERMEERTKRAESRILLTTMG